MSQRCAWAGPEKEYIDYHDREWGVPLHDDRRLFELLVLEGAQAGLSWRTILLKRQNYRRAFDDFDPATVASYGKRKIGRLLRNEGIIRNRLKIESAISNARVFLDTRDQFGSFDSYVWRFVDGTPKINRWKTLREIPATSPVSDRMSKDMKQRGFRFVGSTICYAYMQSIGMVNDHLTGCFRYREILRIAGRRR